MRSVLTWQEVPPDKDGIRSVCYDFCVRPDGSHVVCAVGARVLVYKTSDGELLHALKGHKGAVYCVAYSSDGQRFASGGADKMIIIWTHEGGGILKYQHSESIQCLAYNPLTQQLASGTAADFGLWSPEQRSVSKHKVLSRVLCMAWTGNGQYLALGLYDGTLCLRDKAGEEKMAVSCGGPVWTLSWAPNSNLLFAGAWDGTLNLFELAMAQGLTQVRSALPLGFDPCSIAFFANGEYMLVAGSNRKVQLFTLDGRDLGTVLERPGWVWCANGIANQSAICSSCEDGSIAMHQVVFNTVHGLYQDRYAYRDTMTDVVIQHMITEQKVRIKCRGLVKKLAIYKEQLAVQLPERVMLYELSCKDDPYDMQYIPSTKINHQLDCNLLVVTSQHVILCQEKKLQLYNFAGVKEREWVLEHVIRYIKVAGGPPGREGLLVGIKSGAVLKIFIDNPFPITLLNHNKAMRCVDLSADRSKLAIVDEASKLLIYDLASKELLYEDSNANSVAWNAQFNDMVCYTGNGQLSIKTGPFAVHRQKLQGFVVGFKASKIFCLHCSSIETVDVPQSVSMYRYLHQGDIEMAYRVACLGVTETDWRALGIQAFQHQQLDLAKKAFVRIRDIRFIDLVHRIELRKRSGMKADTALAELAAYQGKYQKAADIYASAGMMEQALEMFADLRQFDQAKKWAESSAQPSGRASAPFQDLIHRQAEWSEGMKDFAAAAEMYVKANKFEKAIAILAKHSWPDKLMDVARLLDKRRDEALLQQCGKHLLKQGRLDLAKEVYIKLEDFPALMDLYVQAKLWTDAFRVYRGHPELKDALFRPYAEWLLAQGRFEEARDAFQQGDQPKLANRILDQLVENALVQSRFGDAALYLFQKAMESLQQVANPPEHTDAQDRRALDRFADCYGRAEVYYAYALVQEAVSSPFMKRPASTLLNCCRFLAMRLMSMRDLPGISLVNIYRLMATHAEQVGAYKLARFAYNRLQKLRLPAALQEQVDLASVIIRSRPMSDAEDAQPVCWRCGAANPLINTQGDCCVNCGAAFIRSFATFEYLPLVEFELAPGISEEEAQQLIEQDCEEEPRAQRWSDESGGLAEMDGGANVLRLDDDDVPLGGRKAGGTGDRFSLQMLVPHAPVVADRSMLRRMRPSEVLVRMWPFPSIQSQYYRVMDPDLPMCCGPCGHFFEEEDFEMEMLEHGRTPFARLPPQQYLELSQMSREARRQAGTKGWYWAAAEKAH